MSVEVTSFRRGFQNVPGRSEKKILKLIILVSRARLMVELIQTVWFSLYGINQCLVRQFIHT